MVLSVTGPALERSGHNVETAPESNLHTKAKGPECQVESKPRAPVPQDISIVLHPPPVSPARAMFFPPNSFFAGHPSEPLYYTIILLECCLPVDLAWIKTN